LPRPYISLPSPTQFTEKKPQQNQLPRPLLESGFNCCAAAINPFK
jgi:hypothetical protein